MDNKITKKRISVHLEYDWLKYILILLASIFVWYFVFMQINVNRDFEKIEVFFTQYSMEGPNLSADFLTELNASGDDVIRDVTINYQSPLSEQTYPTLFQANSQTADIMVVGESYMRSYGLWFRELTPEFVSYMLTPEAGENHSFDSSSLEYYEYSTDDEDLKRYEGRRCGIRIDNLPGIAIDNSPFAFDYKKLVPDSETETDEKFYLVICSSATNIGKYSSNEKYAEYTHALRFVRWFLNRYGN